MFRHIWKKKINTGGITITYILDENRVVDGKEEKYVPMKLSIL